MKFERYAMQYNPLLVCTHHVYIVQVVLPWLVHVVDQLEEKLLLWRSPQLYLDSYLSNNYETREFKFTLSDLFSKKVKKSSLRVQPQTPNGLFKEHLLQIPLGSFSEDVPWTDHLNGTIFSIVLALLRLVINLTRSWGVELLELAFRIS